MHLCLCFLKIDLYIENNFAFIHCKNHHIINLVAQGPFGMRFTKPVASVEKHLWSRPVAMLTFNEPKRNPSVARREEQLPDALRHCFVWCSGLLER